MDYATLLQKARKDLPESVSNKERFEIPKVLGHLQGKHTVISNFLQITKIFNREPEQVLKFVLKEIASPGKIEGQIVIIGSKVSASLLNQRIKQYANTYVLCSECGKPDTQLTKEKTVSMLKCTACGAKHPVRLI